MWSWVLLVAFLLAAFMMSNARNGGKLKHKKKNKVTGKVISTRGGHKLPLVRSLSATPSAITRLTEEQVEEVRFWAPQMKEHALFLYLGLQPVPGIVDDPLLGGLESGTRTQASVEMQQPTWDQASRIKSYKEASLKLFTTWRSFEDDIARNEFDVGHLMSLIGQLRCLKRDIVAVQKTGVWVGWLFPDFVSHVLMELDYFVKRLHNTISAQEESAFWTHVNADHAAFTAHLLNTDYPTTRAVVDQALSLADQGHKSLPRGSDHAQHEADQAVILSERLAFDDREFAQRVVALKEAAWEGKVKIVSIIHPVLLAHVVREGKQSLGRLATLNVVTHPQLRRSYHALASHIPPSYKHSAYSGLDGHMARAFV